MIRSGLKWINIAFCALAGLFLVLALLYTVRRPSDIETPSVASIRHPLPRRTFEQSKDAYAAIGKPFVALSFAPASMQVPDLRKKLTYYGKNSRPDANETKTLMHFDFLGRKEPMSISPGEKLYLCYDASAKPSGYIFSPNNKETNLWMEAQPDPKGAVVKVRMRGEEGQEISFPEAHSQFVLSEKEYNRFAGASWQLGKWRVDGSLFARQHARWYGKDEFFARYGGEEFKQVIGKQRIDFGEVGDAYSVFVGDGDALVWSDDKWSPVEPGPASLGKPLLVVKKIEDRIMNCELWDTEGKAKIHINLLRCVEAWIPNHLEKAFKFVGAHTRSQVAFEINKKRMILSPDDWLVFTPKGWVKLETAKEIDDYVNRKVTGPMFVFEGIGRKEDKQVILGTMFNTSRTEAKEVELPMTQAAVRTPAAARAAEVDDDDEDDEDSDLFESDDDDDDDDFDDDEDEFERGELPEPSRFGPREEDE